ncbi:MAG: metal ABC transporter substrate-binding protein [Actinobacteria bacterium]|nr:metal ABC transporter substrate-binding protein [Actinomycetota bacterium]
MSHRRPSILGCLIVLALVAGGCAGGGPAGEDAAPATGDLRVVATTSILGDIVSDLVGDAGEVEVLMGSGVDPHAFSPSAAQAAAVRDADLVIANGLDLEESLLDLLDAAAQDGATVLEVAPALDPLAFDLAIDDAEDGHAGEDGHATEDEDATEDAHAGEDADDHAEGPDPHVWFDPVRMADGVALIAAALAEVDDQLPDEEWEGRGADAAARLIALDEELRETFATIPPERRVLVTNHAAIGYLAERYDLEIVGTVIPGGGTLASAGAGRLAELADLIRDTGVPAIFAENTTDDRLAQALAREVGRDVAVVELYTDALGEAGSGAETYEGLLRTDAQLIVDALG